MFNNIKIIITDKIICPSDWSWESQRNGWSGFHLWYVTGGGANINVEENTYHLKTGDIFLFDLNKNHFCTHNPDDPLHVATIYFHEENLKSESICRWVISNDELTGKMILRCIDLFEQHSSLGKNYLQAIIGEFLIKDNQKYTKIISAPVQKICEIVESNMHHMYSLSEMSQLTGYSKNQIIRLFRTDTGMTPIQFQMNIKMQYASRMLLYSDKTINEITFETGMDDANYFSKTFKKYMGKSPRNYRDYYRSKHSF